MCIMKPRLLKQIGLPLLIAMSGFGCQATLDSRLVSNPSFPDEEICSLACGSSWTTHTPADVRVTEKGYWPKVGDMIVWKITGDDSTFHGVWYESGKPLKMAIAVNGAPLSLKGTQDQGNGNWHQYHDEDLSKSPAISKGDLIQLTILEVTPGTLVRSLQPSGGH
jgi:exosome complex RNA-binding protein Rrp4